MGIHLRGSLSDTPLSNKYYDIPIYVFFRHCGPVSSSRFNYRSYIKEMSNLLFPVVDNWVDQLRNLNHSIKTSYNEKYSPILLVSRQEWWMFIGIMISAGASGKGGINLWKKEENRKDHTFSPAVDLSKTVSGHRYNCLRQ
jgi:hypothetical protein